MALGSRLGLPVVAHLGLAAVAIPSLVDGHHIIAALELLDLQVVSVLKLSAA